MSSSQVHVHRLWENVKIKICKGDFSGKVSDIQSELHSNDKLTIRNLQPVFPTPPLLLRIYLHRYYLKTRISVYFRLKLLFDLWDTDLDETTSKSPKRLNIIYIKKILKTNELLKNEDLVKNVTASIQDEV